MYERYTHYVPGDSPAMARFVMHLASGYANLCDRVFAPSESVAAVLRARRVLCPIDVVPTGVDVSHFSQGNGPGFRLQLGIPENAFVVGHAGRCAGKTCCSWPRPWRRCCGSGRRCASW